MSTAQARHQPFIVIIRAWGDLLDQYRRPQLADLDEKLRSDHAGSIRIHLSAGQVEIAVVVDAQDLGEAASLGVAVGLQRLSVAGVDGEAVAVAVIASGAVASSEPSQFVNAGAVAGLVGVPADELEDFMDQHHQFPRPTWDVCAEVGQLWSRREVLDFLTELSRPRGRRPLRPV